MGSFYVSGEISGIRDGASPVRIPKMLVDTGSEFSWVPARLLEEATVSVVKRALVFVMANGETITRATGYAIVRVSEFETVDEVVFAEDHDLTLLGARTLEGFGADVDSRRKRLVASGRHLAAPSSD